MISEVYELIDIFPYFQSAHLLLLKGLYSNADVKFENQLKHSAIHIGDREVLYWLLKTKASSLVKTDQEKNIIKKEEIITDTHQTVIESARNSEYLINEIEGNTDDISFREKKESHDLASGHATMIATEPEITEPAEVIFLSEDETFPPEEKVFFMDPGFSMPEHSDLLELDLGEDEEFILLPEDIRGNESRESRRETGKIVAVRTDR